MLLHKIKGLCIQNGINIAELERKAQLKPRTVYAWENTTPSADKLASVARVLGTTVEELLQENEDARAIND